MRRPSVLAFALLACSKITRPVPPAPAPETLIAVVEAPSIQAVVAAAGDYADAIRRGARAMITPTMITMTVAQGAGARDLEGIDLTAPTRVLVLDPKKFERPIVALVKVTDEAALKKALGEATLRRQGAWALVGPAAAVKAVEGYALGTLASQPPPKTLSAVVHMPNVWKIYAAEVAEVKGKMAQTIGTSPALGTLFSRYFDVFFGLAEQTTRVELTLVANAEKGELEIVFLARPGSTFETFCAAQRPFDPALVAHLPGRARGMVMAGQMKLGPLRRPLDELVADVTREAPEMKAGIAAIVEQLEGGYAMLVDLGSVATGPSVPKMIGLYTAKDPKAALSGGRALLDLLGRAKLDVGGTAMAFDVRMKDGVIDGAPWLSYQARPRLAGMTPEQQAALDKTYATVGDTYLVALDEGLLTTMGADLDELKATIAAVRRGDGGHALDGATKALLDDAHARHESAVVLFDLGAVVNGTTSQTPVVLTVGFQDKALRIRFHMPPSTLRAAVEPT